jgi:DivIVA domain-containing protein
VDFVNDDIDVAAVRFRTTRMGYDEAQVDALLDRIGAVLASRDPAPAGFADEVAGASFRVVRFGTGYDMSDVDAFLDQVVAVLRGRATPDVPAPAEPVWNGAVANAARELTYTGDRPVGERFDRTGRLSSGYASGVVDAFVDRVCAQISRPQPELRAHQIESVVFARERRGYDYAAVDDWVARLVAHLRERGLP